MPEVKHVLRLTYDTEQNPLSFDLVFCLAICRAACQANGFADKFDVVLVNRAYRNVGIEASYSDEYRERKTRDVLVNTALLCRWVNSFNLVRGDTPLEAYGGPTVPTREALAFVGKAAQWQITPMTPRQLESILKSGAKIPEPGFRASESILQRYREMLKNAVVIHPRISLHTPSRNTDKTKMQTVIRLLRERGFETYFVPDIEDIRDGFTWSDLGATPLMEAAFDLEVRLGVAETAHVNLIYSGGGNASTLHFSLAKFLWTGFVDDSERVTSMAFMQEKGSAVGVNPPWLDPATQFYDWTPRPQISPEYMVEHLVRLGAAARTLANG
jgi:hypothetical protein